MPSPLLAVALPLYLLAQVWLTVRMPAGTPVGARWSGLAAGFGALPRLLAERRSIRRDRRVGIGAIAGWLAWHPGRLSRRELVVLPPASAVLP